jgi:hypothetical protein
MTINPAAMPVGTELSFGYFHTAPTMGTPAGAATALALIDTNSHNCASTVVTATAPPPGARAWVVNIPEARGTLGKSEADPTGGTIADPGSWQGPSQLPTATAVATRGRADRAGHHAATHPQWGNWCLNLDDVNAFGVSRPDRRLTAAGLRIG